MLIQTWSFDKKGTMPPIQKRAVRNHWKSHHRKEFLDMEAEESTIKQRKAKLLWGWKRMTTRPKFPMFSTEWSRWIHVEQNNQTMTKSFWSSLFLKYNLYNLETSSIFLTFKSLLIFSMDGCIWISGFAVIILKYLLAGCFWIIVEIPGVYTTHYSVRVVFGPSRVRVGQKISSTSRVSSTRRALIISIITIINYYSSLFTIIIWRSVP